MADCSAFAASKLGSRDTTEKCEAGTNGQFNATRDDHECHPDRQNSGDRRLAENVCEIGPLPEIGAVEGAI